MLQNLREHIQGWIASVLIVILAIAFVFWGVEYYFDQTGNRGVAVAKVDGRNISKQEFANYFRVFQRNQPNISAQPQLQDELKQLALQALIANTALLGYALEQGFYVGLAQVENLVQQDPSFQANGRFSPQKLQQLLYANSLTPRQFFQEIQNNLLTKQPAIGIQGTAFVLPEELKQAYELIYQHRDVGYFIIPIAGFLSQAQISGAEIQQYYQQNKGNFIVPESVQVSYLLLSPQTLMTTIKISDQEAQNYYQANAANYVTPQRWQILAVNVPLLPNMAASQQELIYQQLQNIAREVGQGKNIHDLVKNISGAISTTQWLNNGQLPVSLSALVPKLKKSEVSAPIRTAQGYMLVQLLQAQAQKVASFADVKNDIIKMLAHQKAQQIFSQQSDRLTNLTYTDAGSLATAAKALNLPINTSPFLTRQGEKSGIFNNPKVLAAIFSNDVYAQGNNSNPIELSDGSVIVLRIVKKIPKQQQSLVAVQQQIKSILVQQQAKGRVGLEAYQIQTALRQETDLQKIVQQYHLRWIEKNITQQDQWVPKNLLQTAFDLPLPTQNKPSVASVLLSNGDYAVVKLLKVIMPDYTQASDQQKTMLAQQLANFNGQLDYRFYVKSVVDNAKVKIYEQALKNG